MFNRKEGIMSEAESLWEEFMDHPIDDEGNIEEEFLSFPKGTSESTVRQWFEMHTDLMGIY
jgi:hypothetical protein